MISSWPYFSDEEVSAVSDVLRSGLVNKWSGKVTNSFEKEFANYFKLDNALTMANGTLALEAAYEVLNFNEGDEIITSPRTFIATASAAILKGAKVKFADVDLDSGNISPKSIEPLINSKTKAITVVHLGGWPADIKNISLLAKSYNIKLVEDCSQSHGAMFDNKYVGTFSDLSVWSFCNDKIMSTCGEGGMIATSHNELFKKIWSYRDHGKDKQLVDNMPQNSLFKWLHSNFGSNLRMTELQSAVGKIHLSKLENWIKIRTRNAEKFISHLSKIPSVRVPIPNKNIKSAWYKFYCYVIPEALKKDWSRDRIIKEINNLGFPAFSGSCSEIYLERCFRDHDFEKSKRLPNAKKLGETSLMFLVHPTISNEEITSYVSVVSKILRIATK